MNFFELRTIRWEDGKVVLIDQLSLPERLEFLTLRSCEEVADAIKRMAVRGAPAIGVAAAMGIALKAYNSKARDREELLRELEEAGRMLKGTRPTAINLFWAVDRMLGVAKRFEGGLEELKEELVREANRMADEDFETNKRIGEVGEGLIEDGDVVLTHCNAGALATVGYGTALGVLRAARERGKCVSVIATETRPALQGARLTSFELSSDGFHVTLIPDTAVGYVMERGIVDKVLVGADRITRDGHVFNKIGTYQIAVLAERHGIPFYPVAPSSSFDLESDWRSVKIELRGYDEVVKIGGRRIAPKGVNVLNPAFDVTPPELVSAIVTERGIIEKPFEESIPKFIKKNL